MKKIIISGVIAFAVALLAPQITQAQGTMTYLSNLDQASTGSSQIGSNSWLAVIFLTGTNPSGYEFNSFQLAMTDASGNPSGFTVMLHSGPLSSGVGTNLDTLNGSLNPTTSGIYTFTPASNLILSPRTFYSIELTAGTSVANGAYNWSNASDVYNPSGGWIPARLITGFPVPSYQSSDGLNWILLSDYPQYAINATAIPEPGVLSLFGLGGLAYLWHRRHSKEV